VRDVFARAQAARLALGLPSTVTDAYRLVNGEADGCPELTVDVYGAFAVLSSYADVLGPRERAAAAALIELGVRGVYLKHRPRKASDLNDEERRRRAPSEPIAGVAHGEPLIVREHGVRYLVRLGDGLSTGIFLDQRDNRAQLMREAADKSVLNLFSYTCAFGLVAASAGARTTNIDVAKSVLARGRDNYTLGGLALEAHRFLARDVLDTLPRMARAGDRFDVVVLDPPSFASTKGGRFSVERDYPGLVARAAALVAEGGLLLACTNHHGLPQRAFEAQIAAGVREAGRKERALSLAPPPADHPAAPGLDGHLKSAWVRL
jgi:23S rRNA (cytosine1962-C5)-methyltransferase